MPKISNLKLSVQQNSETYYATWSFNDVIYTSGSGSSSSNNGIAAGDWVTITSGATYYNGVSIPSWVLNETWYVVQVTQGDRAVLGKSKSGSYDIQSPISTKYLSNGSGSSSSSGGGTGTPASNHLDHYEVIWYYATGDGVWFQGSDSDVKINQATYSAPSNAYRIKVSVKPVSTTYKVDDEDVEYWSGSWVSTEYYVKTNPPEKPSTPDVKIDKFTLTATLENISDSRTDEIIFQVYSGTTKVSSAQVKVVTRRATYQCTITAGRDYRVRCRSVNTYSKTVSEWSDFSSSAGTITAAPSGWYKYNAMSSTSIYLSWYGVENATEYEIQYTTDVIDFDRPSEVTSVTVEANNTAIGTTKYQYSYGKPRLTNRTKIYSHTTLTGLETGRVYIFRVRAKNSVGESDWSPVISVTIGEKPAAPTTWSSTTTAMIGDTLTLYWVHNSSDNSKETLAEVAYYVGSEYVTKTIKKPPSDDDEVTTSSYTIDTSSYTSGTKIRWWVRTAGVTGAYGPWSIERTIDVYAPVTLNLSITNSSGTDTSPYIYSFPFYVSAIAGPKEQMAVGYHVSITAKNMYSTVDSIGNPKIVNAGEAVYSKYFDTSDDLLLELSANNIDLQDKEYYTLTCTVSMNTGLRTDASIQFRVKWNEVSYEPDAQIGMSTRKLVAYIAPYCYGTDDKPVLDVTLSVYRKNFDGTYTEIATGIRTDKWPIYITDPHPSLDYARYRIVATSKTTGAVSYYDPPAYPIKGKAVVIQWDEEWSVFDAESGDALVDPPWSGSMLQLPYNIDVTDNSKPDVALINYIGRENPVSYYGTQIGSTSTWNVEIPKDDKETLYGLRRLARWMGDVYVREPSGSGYWANIKVSFTQKHKATTIPVTLEITRVEGGM